MRESTTTVALQRRVGPACDWRLVAWRLVVAWALLVTLSLAVTGCQQAARDERRGGDQNTDRDVRQNTALHELISLFQAELDSLRVAHGLPGVTAAFILPDGRCAGVASGSVDLEGQTPLPVDARMPAGSVGKTFVAAVVLALVQEGKLELDDRVADWLGDQDWYARLPNGPELTVRMLLNHTSGIGEYYSDPGFVAELQSRLAGDGLSPEPEFSIREQITYVLDREPLCLPGEEFHYADTNYLLVGLIVEKAAGTRYEDELRRRFLVPLELTLTSSARHRRIPGVVQGHLLDDNPFGLPAEALRDGQYVLHPALEWTGGGVVTNPRDLVRWAKSLYEERALPKPYLQELTAPSPGSRVTWEEWDSEGGTHYGLGVFVRHTGDLGTTYGHAGWFPGYHSLVTYSAKYRIAVAVQVNRDWETAIFELGTALAKVVLDNTIK